ncbi:MAG: hypothetical protein ACREFX_02050 [Opitutaceae bacterium]
MSDIHHIGGHLDAAGSYQAYLERARAARLARRAALPDGGLLSFDSAIDPDRDAGDERGQDREEPEDEQGGETEGRHELNEQA